MLTSPDDVSAAHRPLSVVAVLEISLVWAICPRIVCVTLAVLALLAVAAEAKCPIERYRVDVDVRSSRTNEPIAGAQLTVFANGAETEMPSAPDPSSATTGADGKAARMYAFNTYSGPGFLSADRCDAQLRTLEVVVSHPDYRARRVDMKKIRVAAAAKDGVRSIVIPPVSMDPLER
jgi:hypothetical protein